MLKRPLILLATALVAALAAPAGAQRPVIERIRPTAGPPGTQVELIGRIPHGTQLFLGDVQLPVVERLPHRWTVEIPPAASTGTIVLRTRDGAYAGPRFRVTAARPAPAVTGLEPATAAPGDEVRILGRNFSARLADNRVTLGGDPVVVRSASPTELRIIVPGDGSSGTFTVRVRGATEAAESPPFEVSAGTAITAVEPPRAPPGARVVLRGTGFHSQARFNRVLLGGRRVRVVEASPTALVVQLPRRRISSGRFTVDVRRGGSATSPPFEVAEPVVIRSFEPQSGPPGTEVVVRGSGFGRDVRQVSVRLGDAPLPVRAVDPDTIRVTIAADAETAPFTVSVGGLEETASEPFRVLRTLAVRDFRPHRGEPGTLVRMSGQGFAPDPEDNVVMLGDVRQEVTAASPTGLRVRIIEGPSGPFTVQVHGQSVRTRRPFLVEAPPVIVSFSPHAGPPGSQVTLTGRGFGDSANLLQVELGDRPTRIAAVRDDRLVVEVPRGVRRGRISVQRRTRGGTVTGEDFVVTRRQRVSGLSPDRAIMGAELTIRGEGFPRAPIQVAFTGPRRAVRAERVSPVELRVIVPNGAETGPVELLLPRGRQVDLGTFTVVPTPPGVGVTAVDPECPYPGCRAVLRGHGFASAARNNRVRFRGQPVRVTGATAAALEIRLPDAPGNGRFEVTVRGRGEAESPRFFLQRR